MTTEHADAYASAQVEIAAATAELAALQGRIEQAGEGLTKATNALVKHRDEGEDMRAYFVRDSRHAFACAAHAWAADRKARARLEAAKDAAHAAFAAGIAFYEGVIDENAAKAAKGV